MCTVFENHRKSLIQHCERSELYLHFEWTKCQKIFILASERALPDRQLLIRQKLMENAKIKKKIKCDILSDLQTMWEFKKYFFWVPLEPLDRKAIRNELPTTLRR